MFEGATSFPGHFPWLGGVLALAGKCPGNEVGLKELSI